MGKVRTKDIAIVGMAARFPGAGNYHEYWSNLAEGKCSVTEVPKSRWNWHDYAGDTTPDTNTSHSRWGGFLDKVNTFDAAFFGISSLEASEMDPQQRIMLELTWACLEDAGIPPSELSGQKIGAFMAAFNYDYKELLERDTLRVIKAHQATGVAQGHYCQPHFLFL